MTLSGLFRPRCVALLTCGLFVGCSDDDASLDDAGVATDAGESKDVEPDAGEGIDLGGALDALSQNMDQGVDAGVRTATVSACLNEGCACPSTGEFQETFVRPLPDEIGQWAAGRIPLPSKPFEVTKVRYILSEFMTCDPRAEHEIRLYVNDTAASGETAPPESPQATMELLWSLTPPPPLETQPFTGFLHNVIPPVRVEPGQELFLAVQMAGTTAAHACVAACSEAMGGADRSWWGSSLEEPFPWSALPAFDLSAGYSMLVEGRPLED